VTDCASPIRDAIHPAEDVIGPTVEVKHGGIDRRDSRPVSPIGRDAVVRNRAAEQRHRGEDVCPLTVSELAERRSCHAGAERVGEQVDWSPVVVRPRRQPVSEWGDIGVRGLLRRPPVDVRRPR